MSDEDLFYTPGSIYNREKPKDDSAEIIKRLHRDLRELFEASVYGNPMRLREAQEQAKNTLGWMEY